MEKIEHELTENNIIYKTNKKIYNFTFPATHRQR